MNSRFLEISVTTGDMMASINFYRALGFHELTPTDAWPHAYAVVTDGQLTLGLHSRSFEQPTITLTAPDIARIALQYSDSHLLQHMRIDQDAFNEVLLRDDDDHGLMLVEARTYSPASESVNESLLGNLIECTLPVRDALASAQFWAPWTQQSLGVEEEPRLHMRLQLGGLPLALSETARGQVPVLCYQVTDLARLGVALDRLGLPLQPCSIGMGECFGRLVSPGGLNFALLQEDFLNAS